MRYSYDLIVIGGGLTGGAIAWGAARQGASVVMLDEGDVAYRAALGNFGLVWVQSRGHLDPPFAHWTRRSADLWPDLAGAVAETTGVDVALRMPGGFIFCTSDDEFEERTNAVRRMHNESGETTTVMVDRERLHAIIPGLGDQVVGASFCPTDGHISPLALTRALHETTGAKGLTYMPGHKVDSIDAAPHDFTVHSGKARFTAPRVVIAAGLGCRELAPIIGMSVPVEPLQGQVIVTERVPHFLDYSTYICRQTDDGTVLLGDSQEDAGFSLMTKVSTLADIAARNLRVFPALKDASVLRTWASLRVMPPDGLPIYDQSDRYPGAFAIASHSGVTLAAAHALVLAPAILQGHLPEELGVFSARRFDR